MNSNIECYLSGSTLNLAFVDKQNMELICANVGDSRSIIMNPPNLYEMSIDHKPTDNLEYNRIVSTGG